MPVENDCLFNSATLASFIYMTEDGKHSAPTDSRYESILDRPDLSQRALRLLLSDIESLSGFEIMSVIKYNFDNPDWPSDSSSAFAVPKRKV
jgi:hypothetical protein